jgi:two-component system sensor histidine kinase DegS
VEATDADLILEFDVGRITISVKDKGIGFNPPKSVGELARSGKLGLAGMRERALLLGGDMKIESEPGKGTTITVEAPV